MQPKQPAIATDTAQWFAELDRVREEQLLGKGKQRNQSLTPRRQIC